MNNKNKLTIGLFGFGTVGQGLYEVLNRVALPHVSIKTVCVHNLGKPRKYDLNFTDKPADILDDPEINLVVELIDDAQASYRIVKQALQQGIPVVSGNKKMLAAHLPEMIELQKRHNVALLYDASACGSIPVIRNLEEYYDNDLLVSVKGILNGSSNFILSKIFNEDMTYHDALKLAQDMGFAESDPSLDIDGWDSLFKLIIITVHAFGVWVDHDKIFNYGISSMNEHDIRFALEKKRRYKLVAHVEKVQDNKLIMWVVPQLLSKDKYIYSVEDEFNGVVIKGLFYYKQFMFGRGAGGHPTGSAVLSDITARLYDYAYEYKKVDDPDKPTYTTSQQVRIYYRYNTAADLALVNFAQITEHYQSQEHSYVVGLVEISQLLQVQQQLRQRKGVFLAAYPAD